MLRGIICSLFVLCVCAATAAAMQMAQYTLRQTYAIGGEGSWDYLTFDPDGKRMFIPRSTRVDVVDPYTGKVTASIPNTPGVHGVALAPDLGKGFTSNGRENTVTVFDTKTLVETARVKIDGTNPTPDAIVYDPASKRVFAFNGRANSASVIDAASATVAATIPLDGRPEFAAPDGRGTVFVNIEDKSELTAIDARKATITSTWPLPNCKSPTGLGMDQRSRRLFSACGDSKTLMIVNADTGAIVTSLPIGDFCDAVAFDPATHLIFAPAFDGTLTIIHEDAPDRYTVVQTAQTQASARTLALDTLTHDVYLAAAKYVPATPAPGDTQPRRTMVPGSFVLLVMSANP
jgi:YVTN family beta-propeller protein